ncbi:MAG: TonB-dependent receptor [Rudaea sp.]
MNIKVTSVSRRPEKLSKTASAIQVITGEEIRRSGATSLPEALRLAGNLDVAQKNSHDWAITARGFNTALANKLLVMIDGRTVYTPLFSGVFWDSQNYLLADIDRIEVISGPGGTLWGANAVNGVINIITKRARDTQGLYAEAGGGSRSQGFGGLRYGAKLAPDIYMRVYGESFNRGDEAFADGSPAGDAWRQSRGGFRLDAGASPQNTLTLQGDYYSGDEDVVSGGTAQSSGGNILGRWSRAVSDHAGMSLQAYYDHTHLLDPIPAFVLNSVQFAPAGILHDDLDTFDVDFQYRSRLGAHNEVVWGFGYRNTHDVTRSAPALAFLPPVLSQDLYSGFVQDQWTMRTDLRFTFGSKLEHNDYTGFEVEPSVRLQWDFAANQSLWAAVSRAVRTPSRIDRDVSEPAPSQLLVVLQGSPDFTSESVIARELGYRAEFGTDVAASISAFYNNYHDVRSTGITADTILPLYFQNNLEGETHGVELSVDYRVSDRWRLRGSFDPLKENLRVKPGQLDINDAHNETADPAQRWSLRSSMDLPHRIELNASFRHIAARDINDGATIGIVPGYNEMDIRLGWHATDTLDLSIVGQNLLHSRHAEYGFPDGSQVQIERGVYGKIVWRF